MTDKLDKALDRLERLLPLRQRQIDCGAQIERLHRSILRSFVARGSIPSKDEMAEHVEDLDAALDVLESSGMVVFSDGGEPVGAYPFTMEPREHRVRVNGHQVHVMCALDALAVSPMFQTNARIESRCAVTGDRIDIRQSPEAIENPDEVDGLHLGIDWGAADPDSCCANSLCKQMNFISGTKCAHEWQQQSDQHELFTLPEAIAFARHDE